LFSVFTIENAIGSPTVNFSKSKRHYNGPINANDLVYKMAE